MIYIPYIIHLWDLCSKAVSQLPGAPIQVLMPMVGQSMLPRVRAQSPMLPGKGPCDRLKTVWIRSLGKILER